MNLKRELLVLRAQSETKQSKKHFENIIFLNIYNVFVGNHAASNILTVKQRFSAVLHDL